MAQRLKAKQNYNATINEIEEKYRKLKENSGDLMAMVAKDFDQLDSLLNKKTSTEDIVNMKGSEGETVMSSPSTSSAETNKQSQEVNTRHSISGSWKHIYMISNFATSC